jgi:hypothetical protein
MSRSDLGNNIKKTKRSPCERIVTVVVVNYSSSQLKLKTCKLPCGKWVTLPPEKIPCSSEVKWGSRSNCLKDGTEGSVVYESDYGEVNFYWNNPVGSPSIYRVSCPKEYKCQYHGGVGVNATVMFTITNS